MVHLPWNKSKQLISNISVIKLYFGKDTVCFELFS